MHHVIKKNIRVLRLVQFSVFLNLDTRQWREISLSLSTAQEGGVPERSNDVKNKEISPLLRIRHMIPLWSGP
jgi:hypothetical protein